MLLTLLSTIQISLSYNWIVSDPNRSPSDISSDAFLKIVLYPIDTMEIRLKSPTYDTFAAVSFRTSL